jgi:probable HAF family extracellular repeat protein
MNPITWTRIIALTLLNALAFSVQLAAQAPAQPQHQYHHYQLLDPGTFGGPSNGLQNFGVPRAGVLNNSGTLAGWANTPAADPYCGFGGTCNAGDAFQYTNGVLTDLGRLPGGIDSQANWISGNGLIAGLGDNGQLDPLAGFPIAQSHGLLWENGIMTDLGSLPEGGYLVFPGAVNNQAEVVGFAQNTVPDPNSMGFPGYGTQTRAFYWRNGVMRDLGTLGTGTDAIAALINERGQVVGWSYTNSSPTGVSDCTYYGLALTTGSFLWDRKSGMRDIGGLGGTCTVAQDFNDRGQIVGGSSLTGDSTVHAFVWNAATGVTDLLDPADSSYGYASGENDHGDVAGGVCDAVTCYAVLWRKSGGHWQRTNLSTITEGAFSISINSSAQVVGNWFGVGIFLSEGGGPIVDLSTLIPPNTGVDLYEVDQINDRGEIAASGADASGNNHSVLLIPCDENHPGVEGCDYSVVDAAAAVAQTTPAVRNTSSRTLPQSLMRRMSRYRVPGFGASPRN